ncbi:MAG: M67 family metallopeptidase [Candidatus Limnocylindrales bacterium]
MNDERPHAPEVLSSHDEPAVAGDGGAVPEVDDWQRAADAGASKVLSATGGPRGSGPPWVPASARVPAPLRAELLEWLRSAAPNEGCGVLVADRIAEDGGVPNRFVGMRNVAESPYRYLMDPLEQLALLEEIDERDEVVWGIVHSHVESPPYPSPTDIGLAAFPEAVYLLASFATEPPELRAWTIVDGAVNEVVLERT